MEKVINKRFRWKTNDTTNNGFMPKIVEDYESTFACPEIEGGTYYLYGELEQLQIYTFPTNMLPVVIWFTSGDTPTTLILPFTHGPGSQTKPYYTSEIDIQANKHYEISIINRHIVCVEFR